MRIFLFLVSLIFTSNVYAQTLTVGKVPVASGAAQIIDSGLYAVGYNVGVGSSVPRATLEVGTGTTLKTGSATAVLVQTDIVTDGVIYAGLGVFTENITTSIDADGVLNWGTVYTAPSNGFVFIALKDCTSSDYAYCGSGPTNPPSSTNNVGYTGFFNAYNDPPPTVFPVPKGWYWKCTVSGAPTIISYQFWEK